MTKAFTMIGSLLEVLTHFALMTLPSFFEARKKPERAPLISLRSAHPDLDNILIIVLSD